MAWSHSYTALTTTAIVREPGGSAAARYKCSPAMARSHPRMALATTADAREPGSGGSLLQVLAGDGAAASSYGALHNSRRARAWRWRDSLM